MARGKRGGRLLVFLCMVALLVTLGAAPVRGETTRVDWVFSKDPNITSVEEELPVDWEDTTDEGILGEAVELPILMYHHLTENSMDSNFSKDIMWVGQFRRHMELLQENGYQTVSLDDLIAFGESGTPLPDNPVMITFDDGYESVYTLAYPILQELDMQAVVFPVGVSVGEDTYKGTDMPITPHFTWEQGAEMAASGTISVQSHTYDMHQWRAFEIAGGLECLRPNALRRPEESVFSYANALWDDLQRFRQEAQVTGQAVVAIAYPGGSWDELSERLLASYGIKCTFTIEEGKASVRPGSQKDLFGLNRFYVTPSTTDKELLEWVK